MRAKSSLLSPAPLASALSGLVIFTALTKPAYPQWNAVNLTNPAEGVSDAIAHSGVATQVVGCANLDGFTDLQGALWSVGDPSRIDLRPAGAIRSEALATTGTQQVGYANFGNNNHAGLWNGTAASCLDLNPASATASVAYAVTGTQQVGSATFGSATHAVRWSGSSASWVDLNPAGATGSVAYGITGTQQVGSATFASFTHAGLWNGTAASWVDLNPAGATSSQVNGVFGTQQVGQATFGGATHAGLWNGTAGSWVDLNPPGATSSVARGTSGAIQVGYVYYSGSGYIPVLWSGTAASCVFLPLPYDDNCCSWYTASPAECSKVWSDGTQLYGAGYATRWQYVASVHHTQAILWSHPICAFPGDLNQDGQRNGADIQLFLNCLLGYGSNCSCADVDGNTVVDSEDVPAFVSAMLQ